MKTIKKDVIIVGTGLAGLYAALHIDSSLEIGILSKDSFEKCNSNLAQGGVATCMSKEDSFIDHIKDTMTAGSHHNSKEAVTLLVTQAPSEIRNLIQFGVEFDKDENGNLLLTLEGGHSKRRILHANGDGTGQVIMDTLRKQVVVKKNIEILERTMALKILKMEDQAVGMIVLSKGELLYMETQSIIIATGGIGALYEKTTNYSMSIGDGLVLAKEAGCDLVDPCFVQFHPTGFFDEEKDSTYLVSEAVRGEGGILLNGEKKPFMHLLDERADLAPRDIVARGIFEQMKKDNAEHVWLDIRYRGKEFLSKRFPNIYHHLQEKGIQMEEDLIPVVPVAHYYVGGIKTDIEARTNQRGIYACGEVSATGVHGANRLASNSLLECLVFGKRAAVDINAKSKNYDNKNLLALSNNKMLQKIVGEFELKHPSHFIEQKQKENLHTMQKQIRRIMTNYAGIVRENTKLQDGLKKIQDLQLELEDDRLADRDYFDTLIMSKVAEIVIQDAISQESIGCHYKIKNQCEVQV
ncbi:MAG: L-aspartate oxidase [Vallitaleaceae bacterium]|nr:L-aspartate oxidase [Vallitaleaceae bacterium]